METTIDTKSAIKTIKFDGYKIELGTNVRRDKPTAALSKLLTAGKNKDQYKMLESFYFETEERRREWIKKSMQTIKDRIADKTERKDLKTSARKNMVNPYSVGEFLYDSWGYDQTNIDFYEVKEVKEKSITLQRIGGSMVTGTQGYDCSNVVPDVSNKIGEPFKKSIMIYLNGDNQPVCYIKSTHGGSISKYTKGDKGVYSSWYA